MGKRERIELKLAKGEYIVNNLEYVHQESKDFSSSASLILTNYRLIHKIENVEAKKDKVSLDEVLVKNIDSLDYGVTEGKLPLSPVVIVLCCLFIVGAVPLGILVNRLYGIGLAALGLIILLIAIFLRKKTSAFYIDVYSYNEIFDHLTLKGIDLDAKKQKKKRKKTKKVKVEKTKEQKTEVAINIGQIKLFVDELGAHICELKEGGKE